MRLMSMLVVVGCLLSATPAVAVQILSNPGFETGSLSPWFIASGSGGEAWNVTSADAHSGTFSATSVEIYVLQQDIPPTPNSDILSISLWLRQPEAAVAQVIYRYSDGFFNSFLVDPVTSGWEFFDVTSQLAGAGRTLVAISINGYTGGGAGEDRTFVDDLTINAIAPVPEPGTLLLLGSGLAGLGVRAWRKRKKLASADVEREAHAGGRR